MGWLGGSSHGLEGSAGAASDAATAARLRAANFGRVRTCSARDGAPAFVFSLNVSRASLLADPELKGCTSADTLFLLSRARSAAYETYMFLKDRSEKSLSPGVSFFILMLRGMASPNVSYLSSDTDTEVDMDTVNVVMTTDSRKKLLELSSPHYALSGSYRVRMHQS